MARVMLRAAQLSMLSCFKLLTGESKYFGMITLVTGENSQDTIVKFIMRN